MILSASQLREKEVVNVCDGRRLGFICDFQIDTSCGKICAIYVSDRFFSFSPQKNMLKIPWDKISCIGEDTILVDVGRDACCGCDSDDKRRKKGGWLL